MPISEKMAAQLEALAQLDDIENEHLATCTRLAFAANGHKRLAVSKLTAARISGKNRADRSFPAVGRAAKTLGLQIDPSGR